MMERWKIIEGLELQVIYKLKYDVKGKLSGYWQHCMGLKDGSSREEIVCLYFTLSTFLSTFSLAYSCKYTCILTVYLVYYQRRKY